MSSAATSNELAGLILQLLRARGSGKTICPSEVARAYVPDDWRKHMPAVRQAAFDLADAGRIVILQRGKVIDGRLAKGPIRLALREP
ncbi:MAG: DUF3253 domain-containing protein [Anaerolineae bacterium]|nr:DUF3253 domain-containing protein [Candidatus Roseilinea sp.]MDW8451648.1 DUF3253 domain-containing protein [Anaerolineae bacterium]